MVLQMSEGLYGVVGTWEMFRLAVFVKQAQTWTSGRIHEV
jgi:hypothetical protein